MRRVWAVVVQEWVDALRSRRAVVMLLLYMASAMLVVNGFINFTRSIEAELVQALQLPGSAAGGASGSLWESPVFRRVLTRLAGDADVAEGLLHIQPMAIFYGWAIFFFTPALVMLFSASRIAEDTVSNSTRYILVRATRGEWVAGKFIGQTLWAALALFCAGAGAWLVAYFRLRGMDTVAVAQGFFIFSFKTWVYSLAFIGLALSISQVIHLPTAAMAAGFALWLGTHILYNVAIYYGENGSVLWLLLQVILPQGHRLDMWRTDFTAVLPSALILLIMGVAYLMAGYAFLRRRNL